jgi:hypothetical protein
MEGPAGWGADLRERLFTIYVIRAGCEYKGYVCVNHGLGSGLFYDSSG